MYLQHRHFLSKTCCRPKVGDARPPLIANPNPTRVNAICGGRKIFRQFKVRRGKTQATASPLPQHNAAVEKFGKLHRAYLKHSLRAMVRIFRANRVKIEEK